MKETMNCAVHPPSPTATASVQVVVRLRPLNEKEKKHGTLPVVSASTNDKTVTVIKGQGSRQAKTSYKFDNVFTAFSSQEEVFEATLKPVIRDVLMGFESTVFAYGQTGTGKTHTMEGDLSDPEQYGIIPRSAVEIFDALSQPHYVEKSITVSFLEIYNEDLCDLLVEAGGKTTKKTKLDIMEGKNGPFCRGLSETKVNSAEEVLVLMRKAQTNRQVGETNMNKQSSRSHCIFTLKVNAKRRIEDGGLLELSGKLHCVDLAGSECAKTADLDKHDDNHVARERERKNINQSLLTLGRVVSILKEQSQGKKNKNIRIPYRDSKLTRILQESLGGRCKTLLISTVSPSVTAIEESMSTLNYAQTANGIINKPMTSSLMTSQASFVMQGEKKPSGDTIGTVEHWHEMECRLQYMQSQVEEAQQALARKHLQQQELVEKAEAAESAKHEAMEELKASQRDNESLKKEKAQLVVEKNQITQDLEDTQQTLTKTIAVLHATQKTESLLTSEAQELLSVLRRASEECSAMYASLSLKRDEEISRKQATNSFYESMAGLLEETVKSLNSIQDAQKECNSTLRDVTQRYVNEQQAAGESHQRILGEARNSILVAVASLHEQISGSKGINGVAKESQNNILNISKSLSGLQNSHCASVSVVVNDLRSKISDAASVLNESEAKCMKSSEVMISKLRKDATKLRDNLASMLTSAVSSMNTARAERDENRNALRKIVNDLKGSCKNASDELVKSIGQQEQAIEAILVLLEEDSKWHEQIASELINQRSFVEEQRHEQSSKLQEQNSLLAHQQKSVESFTDVGGKLCHEVITNIMKGVEQLVKNQISEITQHHEKSMVEFASTNLKLIQSNRLIHDSVDGILDQVQEKNGTLQKHSRTLCEKDEKVSTSLKCNKSCLAAMEVEANRNQETIQSATESLTEKIVSFGQGDFSQTEAMAQKLHTEVDSLADNLSATLERVIPSSENLASTMKDTLSYARNSLVDEPRDMLMVSVQEPIIRYAADYKSLDAELKFEVSDMAKRVEEITNSCKSTSNDIRSVVEEKTSEVSEGLLQNMERSKKHQATIIDECDAIQNHTEGHINQSSSHISSANNALSTYAVDVIKATEDTPELNSRQDLSYSDQLSSTPAHDVILANLMENGCEAIADIDTKEQGRESHNKKTNDGASERKLLKVAVLKEKTNRSQSSSTGGPAEINKRGPTVGVIRNETKAKRARTQR